MISHRAIFSSRCSGCGGSIVSGDPITKVQADWICSNCAEDLLEPHGRAEAGYPQKDIVDMRPIQPGEVVCERCFCVHQGEC